MFHVDPHNKKHYCYRTDQINNSEDHHLGRVADDALYSERQRPVLIGCEQRYPLILRPGSNAVHHQFQTVRLSPVYADVFKLIYGVICRRYLLLRNNVPAAVEKRRRCIDRDDIIRLIRVHRNVDRTYPYERHLETLLIRILSTDSHLNIAVVKRLRNGPDRHFRNDGKHQQIKHDKAKYRDYRNL